MVPAQAPFARLPSVVAAGLGLSLRSGSVGSGSGRTDGSRNGLSRPYSQNLRACGDVKLAFPSLRRVATLGGPTPRIRSRFRPLPTQAQAADGAGSVDYQPRMQGKRGGRIAVLSIDGGGIRGLIPTKLLEYLETELQHLDGPDVRLMDYFDMVAGVSTGGLIAGLLNAVDPATNRPRYTTSDATSFYVQNAAQVFPQPSCGCLGSTWTTLSNVFSPKYSNQGLQQVLTEKVGDLRLNQLFKEVLVPTFDVKLEQPRFFSKLEAEDNALFNPLLREACLATSAAPTYLPAVHFQTSDASGNTNDYNCVDGSMAGNNPTYVAIAHAVRQVQNGRAFLHTPSFQGYSDFLVVSLGTGDVVTSYPAQDVAKWGLLSWIYQSGSVPLWDMVSAGSASTVDYNMAVFFEAQQCSDNYLRIQSVSSKAGVPIDDSSAETIAELQQMADELLFAPAERWNLKDGQLVRQTQKGTNADALRRMALELSEERKARQL